MRASYCRTSRAILILGVVLAYVCNAQASYPTPREIAAKAGKLAKAASGSLETLASSPDGNTIQVVTVGEKPGTAPAVFVVANMEGNAPLASVAALQLLQQLGGDWSDLRNGITWYIIPLGNPDGYGRFFEKPLSESTLNGRSINDDRDYEADEDGPDDLNGDGFITVMRQRHPEGEWLELEGKPLLLRKANPAKGEVGLFRLFPEGIDSDGDGAINEDGPGGVNPGHNFPHQFEHWKLENGLFAASEVESRAVLGFAFAHPEIMMTITFGHANTLAEPPPSDRKGESGQNRYKPPKRWADWLGVDPEIEYELSDLLSIVKDATGYTDLSEEQLLQWMGADAAVNPNRDDLAWWKEISERYADFLEEAGLKDDRLDAARSVSGSVEEWAYYQLGVPSFAMNFWTLSKPEKANSESPDSTMLSPEKIERMSAEELLALGDETLQGLIDRSGGDGFTVERLRKGLKGGAMKPAMLAEFLRKAEQKDADGSGDELDEALLAYRPDAFVEWTPYDHPTLGKVEIGGRIPWMDRVPREEEGDSLVAAQLPFIRDLVQFLPEIKLPRIDVTPVSNGVYRIEAYAVNSGFLPYPTHHGKRTEQPAPAVVVLQGKGLTLLEGRLRVAVGLLEGSGGAEKVSWLVAAKAGTKAKVSISTAVPGETVSISLKQGGGR